MTLRIRIGLTMAILTALTAAAVAAAGYRVTANRLDSEINASIAIVSGSVSRSAGEAQRTCSGPTFQETDAADMPGATDVDNRPSDSGAGRNVPRDLLVQCLDAEGKATPGSPSKEVPISASDRAMASGRDRAATRATQATIDGEPHRVVTVRILSNDAGSGSGPVAGAIQVARSLAERDRVLSALLRRVLLLASGATVAAALAGLWLARRIAQPLVVLTGAAEAIAERGQLDAPLAVTRSTRSETDRLSHAFSTMVDSLRQSREQQARLVQDAGHELRTPLTSLRTNIALLQRADLPVAKRDGILADLSGELLELTTITNELIALSANSLDDDRSAPIDLADLVDTTVARWRRRSGRPIRVIDAGNSGHNGGAGGDSSVVSLPPNGAQRVLDNLLSNAVKFSPEGAAIDVELQRTQTVVSVSVRDRGSGVAAKDLGHVFDRFYRADEARPLHGSGLGLSIVYDMITRHGGTVAVKNHATGGAMFTVVMPLLSSSQIPAKERGS